MKRILTLAGKELKTYFGSPIAVIFIGAFLLTALFLFFWIETFFARNLADIRPLFRWMPLLMIFLTASLTMRQWSEEQKMGTLEILLTLPVPLYQLVLGKFIAALALVAMALALTVGLPVSVAFMGNIDWGPVIGGYLGTLLMAAAYIAIGLFVSARTDNQLIALIGTVLLAGLFYLLGAAGLTDFLGNRAGELLRALGTGSRFASIERGIIDLRDVLYYTALCGIFLTLNMVALDRKRWSAGRNTAGYRRDVLLTAALVAANLLALNIWVDNLNSLRLDLTANQQYSLSTTSRDLLANLQEPLLMRGYFSERTHPLLAPLLPRIKDLMQEYEVAAGGRLTVEFVDPKYDEELEAEANQQYGIKPVPFQVAGRYEASVLNSYFHILLKYGDQYVTLSFDELIEIQRRQTGQIDVGLRNLEYDLTKSIKKVVYGFQSLAAVFENINRPMELVAVVTPSLLPEALAGLPDDIQKVAAALEKEANGKLTTTIIDPDDPAAQAAGYGRAQVDELFGIAPLATSLFAEDSYYLHLLLKMGDHTDQIYLSEEMSAADLRQGIEAAIKRSAAGFLKTIGLVTPAPAPPEMAMAAPAPPASYQYFQSMLAENYNLTEVDLSAGWVGAEVDVLLLVAPQNLSDLARFAVDQYLMRGGAVVALAANYVLDLTPPVQSLNVKNIENGINDLLAHYGVTVAAALVMDEQNEPLPIPVSRDLGGFMVREIRRLNYPFFVDIRSDGMAKESPVLANLPAVTMNWASPLQIDPEKNRGRRLVALLRSSPASWVENDPQIQPDFARYPEMGFKPGAPQASQTLAVSVQGEFESFFTEKPDPRLAAAPTATEQGQTDAAGEDQAAGPPDPDNKAARPTFPLIKKSPASARLVVLGSAEFLNDTIIAMSQSLGSDRFLNGLEFLQNIIDWAVEDEDLLAIRSRGAHARLLAPMSRSEQAFWEWLNYGLALAALAAVGIYGSRRRRREQPLDLG